MQVRYAFVGEIPVKHDVSASSKVSPGVDFTPVELPTLPSLVQHSLQGHYRAVEVVQDVDHGNVFRRDTSDHQTTIRA